MVVIDAHVHLFPERLFSAIYRWFDDRGWKIQERFSAESALDRLEQAGVAQVVALLYAHKPEISASLNQWLGELARRRPLVIPSATAHPLDRDLKGLLRTARDAHGARVVKQHCHVLGLSPEDPLMFALYEACIDLGLPLVLHCGSGPKPAGVVLESDALSGVARVVPVLQRYPELRLVVPHLGSPEEQEFAALLDDHPNLFLDTTLALRGPAGDRAALLHPLLARHPGRILFGSDFPLIPHSLETEREALLALPIDPALRQNILQDAAARLLSLPIRTS